MNKERKKNKEKVWLWSALADWYLTDGKRLRDRVAYEYLMKNNPDHPLIQELIEKYKKEKFLTSNK